MDRVYILSFLCIFLFSCANPGENPLQESDQPLVLDNDLQLTLAVEDPDVMTPIGIAIDEEDRLFVLESHTHTPPDDYTGPESDQVKVFLDQNEDGMVDSVYVFASGINDGMNMTFGPDGHLYVVSSQAVTRFPDRDNDGVMDGAEILLRLSEPEYVYDHAALLGVAATPDGWLYIARGNTGSRYWKLEGTDNSYVDGYGDGGNIIRSRLDGSQVEEVATGFWNPFDLKFDKHGRLFVIDNDPDSRGPNRLVDVVKGGDYGYKSLYGGSGIHPFLAWNGELPGTVPYVTGIGEAPSGLFDTRHTSLPEAYDGHFLVTIWEESKITAVGIQEENGVLIANHRDVVQGNGMFRPVAFAANSKGEIYFTDWVVREYPNHGKGRIWKLTAKQGVEALVPQPLYADFDPGPSLNQREQLASLSDFGDTNVLSDALLSEDAHLQALARDVLKQPVFRSWLYQAFESDNIDLQLQAALVLETLDVADEQALVKTLLEDNDEQMRHAGLLWAARKGLGGLLPQVDSLLEEGKITPGLFDAYLSTLRHLQPAFIAAYSNPSLGPARSIERVLPDGYLSGIILNPDHAAELRAMAMSRLDGAGLDSNVLKEALLSGEDALQEAVIFYLLQHKPGGGAELLVQGLESGRLSRENSERALLALSWYPEEASSALPQPLLDGITAWREPPENMTGQPGSTQDWIEAIEGEGDSENGQLVFYSTKAQCSTCHVHNEWGGIIGPDLSNIGQSKSREQILSAILDPSAEIAPEWQGWYVTTAEGATIFGRQIDVGLHRAEIMTLDGTFKSFPDIAGYGIAPSSLMPDGLEGQVTADEMRDLIAFLMDE